MDPHAYLGPEDPDPPRTLWQRSWVVLGPLLWVAVGGVGAVWHVPIWAGLVFVVVCVGAGELRRRLRR